MPLTSCRFNIPGEAIDVKLNPKWPNPPQNYRYYGNGLENGQCGITFLSVREQNYGNATCILDPNDGQPDAVANIEIIIAKAPHPPQMKIEGGEEMKAGDRISATCESQDGRPAANLTWYINDQPLGSGHTEIFDSSSDGSTYWSVHSELQYQLRAEDDKQNLICRAYHSGYPEGFLDVRQQLNINFRPVPMSDIFVPSLEIGSTATIGPIQIQANPRPTVRWSVNGVNIEQGQQKERYVAPEPVQAGIGLWNVSLTVVELTLEDTTRSYKLRATNQFGTTDYTVRIGGSQEVAGEIETAEKRSIVQLGLTQTFSRFRCDFFRFRSRHCGHHRHFDCCSFSSHSRGSRCGSQSYKALVFRR